MENNKVSGEDLVEGVIEGSRQAVAKMISLAENNTEDISGALDKLETLNNNRAYVIGVTGYAGAGKSTLVDNIVGVFRERDYKVGIIAIDPTSPFSGGALLGDRLRMTSRDSDDGVFIRSIATRGALGGLSSACLSAVKILDASGKDLIIIETVGIGQDEVEITNIADLTILTLMPGGGDEIQLMKAGVMEIADIFVVNKADLPGAERLVIELKMKLDRGTASREWKPPVLSTIALEKKGILGLIEVIDEYREFQVENDILQPKRRERKKLEISSIVEKKIGKEMQRILDKEFSLDEIVDEILAKKRGTYSWAEEILKFLIPGSKSK